MKKLISITLVFAMLLAASVSAFACKGSFEPAKFGASAAPSFGVLPSMDAFGFAKLDADTSAKIQAAKDSTAKEIVAVNETIKTLNADLKTAKSANPVDKDAVTALKDKIAAAKAEIWTKQKALNDTVNRIIMVAKYGEDAVSKIEAAKASNAAEVAAIQENLKTLYADLKTAMSADPVDKDAVTALKDKIAAANSEIWAKQKALNDTVNRIIMVAKYGEEAVAKIEAAKTANAAEVAVIQENLKTLNSDLKAALKATPVDKAVIKDLKDKIAAANAKIRAKQKALNNLISSIINPTPVATAAPVVI